MGCLASIPNQGQKRYASNLARLVGTGGRYMLYAWLPTVWKGKLVGLAQKDIANLFTPAFVIDRVEIGKDRKGDSAWYWLTRT